MIFQKVFCLNWGEIVFGVVLGAILKERERENINWVSREARKTEELLGKKNCMIKVCMKNCNKKLLYKNKKRLSSLSRPSRYSFTLP